MPVNITDSNTFTDPVQAPDDGDNGNGATFQLAPQALANRTRNLKNRLDAADADIADLQTDKANLSGTNTFSGDQTAPNWLHATPKAQTRTKSGYAHGMGGSWSHPGAWWQSEGDFVSVFIPITDILIPGAGLDEFSVRWKPGAARTGSDRLSFTLLHRALDGTQTNVLSTIYSDASSTDEHTTTEIAIAHTVLTGREYLLQIVSGSDGSTNKDRWYGVSAKQLCSKAGLQT